jgi:hypothetical protein
LFFHLLEYRIVPGHEAELTGFLRQVVSTAEEPDGLVARFAGRRLSRHGRKHLVASTWRDEAALARNTDENGVPAQLAEKSALMDSVGTGRYRVTASTGLDLEGARVIRLHRTLIAAGAAGIWERRTIETFDRLVSRAGLIAAVAGIDSTRPPVAHESVACIAVVTTWVDWDHLLVAAGGRLDRALLDDDFADLEEPSRANHFELLRPENEAEQG